MDKSKTNEKDTCQKCKKDTKKKDPKKNPELKPVCLFPGGFKR